MPSGSRKVDPKVRIRSTISALNKCWKSKRQLRRLLRSRGHQHRHYNRHQHTNRLRVALVRVAQRKHRQSQTLSMAGSSIATVTNHWSCLSISINGAFERDEKVCNKQDVIYNNGRRERAKEAVPFRGKFRLIDFTQSTESTQSSARFIFSHDTSQSIF